MSCRRAAKSHLASSCSTRKSKTSNQIVILTVNSLDGEDIEGYANRVFHEWRLGQKEKRNGVLLVAAIKDRKLRIEVGYGLEGVLTDALSSQIIRNEIAPKFKAGDYDGGLWVGVNAIDKAIRGEYKADPRTAANAGNVLLVMIVVIIFLIIYVRMTRYTQRRTGIPWWDTGGSGWSGIILGWFFRRWRLFWRRRWLFRWRRRFRRRRRQRRLVTGQSPSRMCACGVYNLRISANYLWLRHMSISKCGRIIEFVSADRRAATRGLRRPRGLVGRSAAPSGGAGQAPRLTTPHSPFPTPHSPFPIPTPHWPRRSP